jgi:hypothetical protein
VLQVNIVRLDIAHVIIVFLVHTVQQERVVVLNVLQVLIVLHTDQQVVQIVVVESGVLNEVLVVLIYHVGIIDQVKVVQNQAERSVLQEHIVLLVQLVVQIVLLIIILLMLDHAVVQNVQIDKLVLLDLVVVLRKNVLLDIRMSILFKVLMIVEMERQSQIDGN